MRSMRPALALLGCLFLLLPAAPRAEELDEGDKRFLSDVLPLILPDERALFEKLEDKADRIVFQEVFWARRDPNLATPENEFQRQYVKDRATADQRYGVSWAWGSATDCGRLFILAGKPDSVVVLDRLETIGEMTPSGRRPELWVYRDRPERRTGFGRFEALFDKECRSRGDLGRGGDITAQLDRIAATKIVHPGIDYVVGRDGHLVKPGDQSARIPGKTIVVDVVVTDDDGQPITDLAQTDIELYEDGVRQPITSFERFEASAPPLGMAAPLPENAEARTRVSSNTGEQDPRGRTFVIVFDDAHLTVDTARQARAAAALFLSAETREGDRVTLVAPAAGVWWNARMPEDRETLLERLDTLRGSLEPALQPDPVTDYESMRGNVYRDRTLLEQVQDPDARRGVGQGDPMDRARDPGRTRRDMASPTTPSPALAARSQLTLEAAERALRSLVGHRGRKSLILASDGFIHDDRVEAWKRTVTASLRAHTAIYFLNTRGLQAASESDEEKKIEALESVVFGQELETAGGAVALAQDTGGFIVRNTDELLPGLRRIADETRACYLIGYNPTSTDRDGEFRKIDIKVPGREDSRVRARTGYYALPSEAIASGEQPSGDTALQETLDSPYPVGDIGLRMTHVVGEEAQAGAARVSLAVEVDIEDLRFEEQAGRDVAALRFVMIAMGRTGDRQATYDQKVDLKLPPDRRAELAHTWLPIVRELELEAGSYRAKVVVEDRAAGRLGSLIHDFVVPVVEPYRLRVSTPVLSDVRVPRGDGLPGARLAIIVRREFTPDAALHCRFEVYGAARLESSGMPRVSASYEVRRSDGVLYTRGALSIIESAADGAASHVIRFPLRAATADDYEIGVHIKDELSGQTLTLRETFSVTKPAATAGAPPSLTAEARNLAGYLDLVDRSCGRRDAASVALARWSSRELERAVQELRECDRCRRAVRALAPSMSPANLDLRCVCPPPPWARAAALHTGLAFALEPEAGGLFHLGLAARLLRESGGDDLQRRWYRAVGLNLLFGEQLGAARSYLEEGHELFEDDPGLLVALGAVYEAESWHLRLELRALEAELRPVMVNLAKVRGEQRHYWSRASDLYQQALDRDPEHSEARLRLGCVELLRGHTDEGLELLQWVTDHVREPDLVYLAHLFIGRELKRSGDLDGALASYRAALEIDPLGQAAYIATSHALRMSGRPTEAAEVLTGGLATRRPELTRDSWWRYPQARLGHALELLGPIRDEVCQ